MKKQFILVHGPTGVGKSDTITQLGQALPIELINCDVGQFYEPFAIGTAKPDWQDESIPHHLFDLLKEPKDLTVTEYRFLIQKTMNQIWQRGNVPVLVGGSGFYGKSLFFPPRGTSAQWDQAEKACWQKLHELDPERAAKISKNDDYRIKRALLLQKATNKKASEFEPQFEPLEGDCLVIFLNRDREELYQRINTRTEQMLQDGWIEEVKKIVGTDWETFLERKKLIGYTEILKFIKEEQYDDEALKKLAEKIAQKTRHYAKRQVTFWKMFKKLLDPYFKKSDSSIIEIDLSKGHRKIKELLQEFFTP
jgi:tRNA dimethylallyltransferase